MYSVFFLEGLLLASLPGVPGVRWPRSWLMGVAFLSIQYRRNWTIADEGCVLSNRGAAMANAVRRSGGAEAQGDGAAAVATTYRHFVQLRVLVPVSGSLKTFHFTQP
jgi:hypothetical protein